MPSCCLAPWQHLSPALLRLCHALNPPLPRLSPGQSSLPLAGLHHLGLYPALIPPGHRRASFPPDPYRRHPLALGVLALVQAGRRAGRYWRGAGGQSEAGQGFGGGWSAIEQLGSYPGGATGGTLLARRGAGGQSVADQGFGSWSAIEQLGSCPDAGQRTGRYWRRRRPGQGGSGAAHG